MLLLYHWSVIRVHLLLIHMLPLMGYHLHVYILFCHVIILLGFYQYRFLLRNGASYHSILIYLGYFLYIVRVRQLCFQSIFCLLSFLLIFLPVIRHIVGIVVL